MRTTTLTTVLRASSNFSTLVSSRLMFLTYSTLTSHTDSDSSEPEITAVRAKPRPSTSTGRTSKKKGPRSRVLQNGPIRFPCTEIPSYNVSKGFTIRPGDTVELVDHSSHEVAMHSADFLRVRHIIRNQETRGVKLRGHRLRRTKYLEQIFDCKWRIET